MKKHLTLMTLFTLCAFIVNAQWVEQATGFSEASRGLRNISIVDANTVWVNAYDGSGANANIQEFSLTTDGGTTWTPGSVNVGNSSLGIAMINALSATTAYAATFTNSASPGGQGIFITTDAGATWTRQTTADYQSSTSFSNVVYFWDESNGFCMGDPINGDFELYTTTDGGENWTIVDGADIPDPLNGEYGYVGQYAASGDHIWYTTNKGRLYHSPDKGYTWTVAQTPLSDFGGTTQSASFDFSSGTNGLVVDNTNNLYETTDGGDTWTELSSTGHYATDIAAIPGMEGTYVNTGGSDGVSFTNFNGHVWTQLEFPGAVLETSWFDVSTGWAASFNTDATTGGIFKFEGTIPSLMNNDLGVINITNPVSGLTLSATEQIKVMVMNLGADAQTGFDVSYTINDGTEVTETSTATINSGATYEYTFTATEDLTATGYYNITAKTVLTDDEDASNDEFSANPYLLSFLPTKKVVYEEGTGTWCGWCVRGLVGLNTMHHNITDGTWIGIGVHNADPMVVTEYDAAVGAFISGYPSGIMDRHPVDIDPGLTELQSYYNVRKNEVPLAKIEATSSWNEGSREITVEVSTTFGLDIETANYNAAVIVVENGVTGTADGYSQANYYNGGTSGDMEDWDGLDYTTAGNPVAAANMTYNHVGRALLGGWSGDAGSIPASITHDTPYSYTYNHTLLADQDENEIMLVGIIIDNATGQIINAVEVELTTVGINAIQNSEFSIYPNPSNGLVKLEGASGAKIMVYNMVGELIYSESNASENCTLNLSHSGNYIVKLIKNNKVFTQKLVITK